MKSFLPTASATLLLLLIANLTFGITTRAKVLSVIDHPAQTDLNVRTPHQFSKKKKMATISSPTSSRDLNLALSQKDLVEIHLDRTHSQPLPQSPPQPTKVMKMLNIADAPTTAFTLDIESRTTLSSNGKIQSQPNPLFNYANCQYILRIAVGQPQKYFKVIIDTGSTTNLLITDRCSNAGCQAHQSYRPNGEGKYEAMMDYSGRHKITYGAGEVDYIPLEDSFWIEDIEIKNQSFGGVIDQSIVFDDAAFDGLVGLSYAALGTQPGMTTLFDNIIRQKLLKKNAFGFFISRDAETVASRFWLGGVNLDYVIGMFFVKLKLR